MVSVPPFVPVPGVLLPPDGVELELLPPQPAASTSAAIGSDSRATFLSSARIPTPQETVPVPRYDARAPRWLATGSAASPDRIRPRPAGYGRCRRHASSR